MQLTYTAVYIPASVRLMLMSLPSSRLQRTVNGSVPVALQVNVTELCSRAVTSELLSASSILGGTGREKKSINRIIRRDALFSTVYT